MRIQPVAMCNCTELVQMLCRLDAAIDSVFKTEQTGYGEVKIICLDRCSDIFSQNRPVWLHWQGTGHGPTKRCCAASLIMHDMILTSGQKFLASAKMGQQRDEIALCP